MSAKRYELNEAQWARISPLLPGKAGDRGRTASDNRVFVNGYLWILGSGAHWSDLPERERRILLMRFYGNMTQSEIGEQLGLSQMHVSRLLSQSLGYLRGCLLGGDL